MNSNAAMVSEVSEMEIRGNQIRSLTVNTPMQVVRDSDHDNLEEVSDNFLSYLTWQGLSDKKHLLVLSSKLHYYYDYEELKDVKTILNLKKLNNISNLDDFLKVLRSGLSPRTNFIGCFADRKNDNISLTSRVYKRFINFIDARTDVELDGKRFYRLLESNGFKVIDMTEINGLTYFCSQNLSRTAV